MIKEIETDAQKLCVFCDEINIHKERDLLTEIILNMKDTMRSKQLAALSANQIGYYKRVVVMNFNGKLQTFINPLISHYRKPTWGVEANPSVPDKEWVVLTFDEIDLFYQTPLGVNSNGRLRGLSARIMQQQLNLLNGVLISDYGLEYDDELKKLSDDELQQLVIEVGKKLAEDKEKQKNDEQPAE